MKQFHKYRFSVADIPASVVVYLVALPLCLGVAVASDALPIAGIIAGIAGGIVTGFISKSHLSVSGPAAGLTAIVSGALGTLPSYEVFLLSVVLAGIFQIILGFLKAGIIGDFIPNSVIKGMLAAIGLILILKQIPHFLGYDEDPLGDEAFLQPDQQNTFSEILQAIKHPSAGAILIGLAAMGILLLFETKWIKQRKLFTYIPGPLLVVIAGITLNSNFNTCAPNLFLKGDHLVNIPLYDSMAGLFNSLPRPDMNGFFNSSMWFTAITLAIVASLETLLSIEAVDKLDPEKALTPNNWELKAQGAGNIVSGLLGGLPITSVIVRSSANVYAGARSKVSTILHGFLLLVSILFFPQVLNKIPLAALAAILIVTGYKLAKVSLFRSMYQKGWDQFVPFTVTVGAIIVSDLLKGIAIGLLAGLFFVIRSNFKTAVFVVKDEFRYLIRFRKEVSFLNKALVKSTLEKIPDDTAVLIDATRSEFIDKDIVEVMDDFIVNAEKRNIRVYIKRTQGKDKQFFNDIHNRNIE
jgi:MFS superfamily sulfate permease-like transporter